MRTAGTTGKRIGYGWQYNYYAAIANIAPYAGDDGLYFEAFLQEWSDQIDYLEGDYVLYNNEVYRAIANVPIGTEPTNTQYWEHIPTEDPNAHPYSDGDYIRDGSELYIFHDWRTPSDDDWKDLESYLGMSASVLDNTGYRGTNEGYKLMAEINELGTGNELDSVGLKVLGGGGLLAGTDLAYKTFSVFVTTTVSPNSGTVLTPIIRQLDKNDGRIRRDFPDVVAGGYIRCVQQKSSSESNGTRGTITDIEGNQYEYVALGGLRWFTKNLQTTKLRDNTPITEVNNNSTFQSADYPARRSAGGEEYAVYPPER